MKKIIILLISLFLVSGCTVDYELEIFNEDYNENIQIYSYEALDSNKTAWEIPIYKNEKEVTSIETSNKVDGVEYYDKKADIKNNIFEYNYFHQFRQEDYYRSYFANTSYNFLYINYNYVPENEKIEKDMILISTGFDFKVFEYYPKVEKVNVIIKTNHKVYSNNADIVDKYTYTWTFTKDNNDKAIQLVLYKDKYEPNYNNQIVKLLALIAGLIILVAIVALTIYNKSQSINKI